MMAPDLPLEPAPRNAFSSKMTRPTRREARAWAMLVPITPPPIIRMSAVCDMLETYPTGLFSLRPAFRPGTHVGGEFLEILARAQQVEPGVVLQIADLLRPRSRGLAQHRHRQIAVFLDQ